MFFTSTSLCHALQFCDPGARGETLDFIFLQQLSSRIIGKFIVCRPLFRTRVCDLFASNAPSSATAPGGAGIVTGSRCRRSLQRMVRPRPGYCRETTQHKSLRIGGVLPRTTPLPSSSRLGKSMPSSTASTPKSQWPPRQRQR